MIFWSLIVLVLLSPIPFGSIYPWSYTLMSALVGAMLLAWTARRIATRQSPPVSLRHIWFIVVPFALVVIWILLQMATFTPESWHHPLWKSASEILETEIPGRISVDPFETGTALMRLMTYAGIFFLSLHT